MKYKAVFQQNTFAITYRIKHTKIIQSIYFLSLLLVTVDLFSIIYYYFFLFEKSIKTKHKPTKTDTTTVPHTPEPRLDDAAKMVGDNTQDGVHPVNCGNGSFGPTFCHL